MYKCTQNPRFAHKCVFSADARRFSYVFQKRELRLVQGCAPAAGPVPYRSRRYAICFSTDAGPVPPSEHRFRTQVKRRARHRADFSRGDAVLVALGCETDFVAKNDIFQGFVKDVASVIAAEAPADVEALKAMNYPGTDRSITDVTNDRVLSIGENIQIRRFERYDTGVNVSYIHAGGKVGVLVNMEVEGIEPAAVTELGKDVAMQICAMNPAYRDKTDVSEETLENEKKIQLAAMDNDPKMANKPQQVKEKIVLGKMGKYYEENCLMQMEYVKEKGVSVEQHVAAVAKSLGGTVKVVKFTRFATGEGIEKQVSDLAAEVAAMVKG